MPAAVGRETPQATGEKLINSNRVTQFFTLKVGSGFGLVNGFGVCMWSLSISNKVRLPHHSISYLLVINYKPLLLPSTNSPKLQSGLLIGHLESTTTLSHMALYQPSTTAWGSTPALHVPQANEELEPWRPFYIPDFLTDSLRVPR